MVLGGGGGDVSHHLARCTSGVNQEFSESSQIMPTREITVDVIKASNTVTRSCFVFRTVVQQHCCSFCSGLENMQTVTSGCLNYATSCSKYHTTQANACRLRQFLRRNCNMSHHWSVGPIQSQIKGHTGAIFFGNF